jgi:hypothetical protein
MNLYLAKLLKEGDSNMHMEICSELGKRVMCFMTDDSDRSNHDLTKVSQHLPGGTEKTHSENKCYHRQDSISCLPNRSLGCSHYTNLVS